MTISHRDPPGPERDARTTSWIASRARVVSAETRRLEAEVQRLQAENSRLRDLMCLQCAGVAQVAP